MTYGKLKILFVCSMARLRSKTAAHMRHGINVAVDYAGTDNDADKHVTQDMMEWADHIVCMEMRHRSKLRRKFKGYSHKMVVFNIPDVYDYMDDTLVNLLRGKVERLVKSL